MKNFLINKKLSKWLNIQMYIIMLSIGSTFFFHIFTNMKLSFMIVALFWVILTVLTIVIFHFKALDTVFLWKDKAFSLPGIYLYAVILCVLLVVYGMLIKQHYNSDTYMILYKPNELTSAGVMNGRLVFSAISIFFSLVHVNLAKWQSVFTVIFIMTIAFCISLVVKELLLIIREGSFFKSLAVVFATILCFCNVFLLEWFFFPEIGSIFSVCLIAVTGASVLMKAEFSWKRNFISLFLLMIAVHTYQAVIGFYLILSLIFLFLRYKGNFQKKVLFEIGTIYCIGVIASLSNVFVVKLLKTQRGLSLTFEQIKDNIQYLASNQSALLGNFFGLMPKYIAPLLLITLLIALLFSFLLSGKKMIHILYQISLLLLAYVSVFIPHLISNSQWLSQRSMMPFFAFLSLTICVVIENTKNVKFERIVLILSILFVITNIFQIQQIILNHFANNKLDREMCILLDEKIQAYEDMSGIQVLKVAFKEDTHLTYTYNSIDYTFFDINKKAFSDEWSRVHSLNYYTYQGYEQIEMPEDIYETYFGDTDWEFFDFDEQGIFLEDTLYLMLY